MKTIFQHWNFWVLIFACDYSLHGKYQDVKAQNRPGSFLIKMTRCLLYPGTVPRVCLASLSLQMSVNKTSLPIQFSSGRNILNIRCDCLQCFTKLQTIHSHSRIKQRRSLFHSPQFFIFQTIHVFNILPMKATTTSCYLHFFRYQYVKYIASNFIIESMFWQKRTIEYFLQICHMKFGWFCQQS